MIQTWKFRLSFFVANLNAPITMHYALLSFPTGEAVPRSVYKCGEADLHSDSFDLAGFHGCNRVFGSGLHIPFNPPLVTLRLGAEEVHPFLCFHPVNKTQQYKYTVYGWSTTRLFWLQESARHLGIPIKVSVLAFQYLKYHIKIFNAITFITRWMLSMKMCCLVVNLKEQLLMGFFHEFSWTNFMLGCKKKKKNLKGYFTQKNLNSVIIYSPSPVWVSFFWWTQSKIFWRTIFWHHWLL